MMEDTGYEIIRGDVDGKHKYCRIPIRSKTAEAMMENDIQELNADLILSMEHDMAIRMIDAIIADWQYWLARANEFFVRLQAIPEEALEWREKEKMNE